MRRTRSILVLALSLGILLAPAAQVCASASEMPADCPMLRSAHGEHGSEHLGAPAALKAPAGRQSLCHQDGAAAADCCQLEEASGTAEAIAFSFPEVEAPSTPTGLEMIVALDERGPARPDAFVPALPPPQRCALLSTFLL